MGQRVNTSMCTLPVHVCNLLQALVSLDQIPPEQMRPEFRQGVASLLQVILAKVGWKCLGLSSLACFGFFEGSQAGKCCTCRHTGR